MSRIPPETATERGFRNEDFKDIEHVLLKLKSDDISFQDIILNAENICACLLSAGYRLFRLARLNERDFLQNKQKIGDYLIVMQIVTAFNKFLDYLPVDKAQKLIMLFLSQIIRLNYFSSQS